MIREVDAPAAKQAVHGPGELAFLDVREVGQFGEAHPLFAVPLPYSRLEIDVPRLVPNGSVPVLLVDGANGVAGRAALRLAEMGYKDVGVLAGGAPAWAQAGFTLFKGVNVPSKILGELAEEAWHPPAIAPETLKGWREAGRSFRLFDVRPPAEHGKMRVPGARCLPNGELLHRLSAAGGDPAEPIVVACAGRTRGIIGALSLKLAGIDRPIYALENGTQGWALAGLELERGSRAEPFPEIDAAGRVESGERARAFAARWAVPWLDGEGFRRLARDQTRSLYLLDVRSAAECAADPVPGAVHAPAGQLVQATDQWVGIRRARVVLADDTGLRAAITAFWLRQIGFEAYALADAAAQVDPEAMEGRSGIHTPNLSAPPAMAPVRAAAEQRAGRALILDLRPSPEFRQGHPAGAIWSVRPRLASAVEGSGGAVHLLTKDMAAAALASVDLAELGIAEVRLIEGGIDGWRAAGLPVEATPHSPPDHETIDFLWFVHDRHDGNLASSRLYLAWEQGLVGQLDAEERSEFSLPV